MRASRFIALCVAVLFAAVPVVSAAPLGILSGKVKGAVTGASVRLPSVVRALNIYAPETDVGRRLTGPKYSFKVAPGPYAVVATVWNAAGTSYRQKVALKIVKKKKGLTRQPLKLRRTAAPPDGPVVSVGNIRWVNSLGQPYLKFDGKPWLWDEPFIVDLAAAQRSCPFHVGEDREFGRFGEVLKEIKLGSSKLIDPSQRLNYRKALATLAAWAPTFRLTGTFTSPTQDWNTGMFNLQLVDLGRGKTVWRKGYTVTGSPFDVSSRAAKDLERFFCGDLPQKITGSYSSKRTLSGPPLDGNVESYSGTVTYELAEPDFWRKIPYPQGIGQYAPYIATVINFNGRISGGSPCSVDATHSDAFSKSVEEGGVGLLVQLEVRPEEDQERRYALIGEAIAPTTTTETLMCAGDPPVNQTKMWGPALQSPQIYEQPYHVSGSQLTGSYHLGIFDYQWSFEMIPFPE